MGQVAYEKFEIIEPIGSGGMGKVFKARQIDLDKLVALKVLDSISNSKAVIRFQNEARAVSKLSHPNIARVLDFGVTKSGEPYMSMELVDGITLQRYLTIEGRLEPQLFLTIFIQVADALAHAHEKGIVHRDLKPGNIMIEKDENDNPIVKVLDFGVAKVVSEDEEGFSTDPGSLIGSPLYMSPEQANGETTTARSDMYSLGCVMFQCLVGRPPFEAESTLDLLVKHRGEPTPDIRAELPDEPVSEDLALMMERLMDKDPDNRFATTGDIAAVLRDMNERLEADNEERKAIGTDKVDENSPGRTFFQFIKAALESRYVKTLAVALLLLALIPAVFMLIPKKEEKKVKLDSFNNSLKFEIAEKFNLDAVKDQLDNNGNRIFMDFAELKNHHLKILEGRTSPEYISVNKSQIDDRGLKYFFNLPRLRFLDLSSTRVKTMNGIDNLKALNDLILADTRITDEALENVAKVKTLEKLDLSDTDVTKFGVLKLAACPALKKTTLDNCKLISREDIASLRQEMPLCEFPPLPGSLVGDVDKALDQMNNARAIQLAEIAIKSIEKNADKTSKLLVRPLLQLSVAHRRLGDQEAARKQLARVDGIVQACGCSSEQLLVRESMFMFLCDTNQLDEAIKLLKQIKEAHNTLAGTYCNPPFSDFTFRLAEVYGSNKRWEEAAKTYKQCAEMRVLIPRYIKSTDEKYMQLIEESFGPAGVATRTANLRYGQSLIAGGNREKGEKIIRLALKNFPLPLKKERIGEAAAVIRSHIMLTESALRKDRLDEAKQHNDRAVEMAQQFNIAFDLNEALRQRAKIAKSNRSD